MTRVSNDEFDDSGSLVNGYDYERQAWVLNGLYQRCGHPDDMQCDCYGKLHEGEKAKVQNAYGLDLTEGLLL